jgi:hypothetical protein
MQAKKTMKTLGDLQSILDVESQDVDGFAGRLFVTDAHLVRLVRGDVDPYLGAVAAAYVIDDPVQKDIKISEGCLTKF